MSVFLNLYISNLNNIVIGVGEMTCQGRVLVVLLEDGVWSKHPFSLVQNPPSNSRQSNAFFVM